MSVRVMLVDDHRLVREGLRKLLTGLPDVNVCGEAADGIEAVAKARELRPHLVIMDLAMDGMNGIEATLRLKETVPDCRVLALSMHNDKRFVTEALRAGASGYLLKDSAFEELVLAIRTVLRGKLFLSAGVGETVLEDYVQALRQQSAHSSPAGLTSREREVLQLMAEGRSTKEIAHRLGLSVKTVETHRKQIMDRLGLRSVAELTKYAIREGLTHL